MKVIRKKLFFLSSADRQATESINKFSIFFPDNLMNIEPGEKISINLIYFSLLNSLQCINDNNNKFIFTYAYTYGGTQTIKTGLITLPSGSMSVIQIAANVTAQLNAFTFISGIQQTLISVSIPDTTTYYGYWSWADTPGYVTNYLKLDFVSTIQYQLANSSKRVLGFNTNSYTFSFTNTNTPLCMFSGQIPFLRLQVDVPPQNCQYSKVNNQLNYSSILGQIPILCPPYDPIIYEDFAGDGNSFQMPATGMKIGTMNFRLTDQYDTLAILQDEFYFTLKVEVMIDADIDMQKTMDDISHTLKIQTLMNHS
jgi:hypothetical protein